MALQGLEQLPFLETYVPAKQDAKQLEAGRVVCLQQCPHLPMFILQACRQLRFAVIQQLRQQLALLQLKMAQQPCALARHSRQRFGSRRRLYLEQLFGQTQRGMMLTR